MVFLIKCVSNTVKYAIPCICVELLMFLVLCYILHNFIVIMYNCELFVFRTS